MIRILHGDDLASSRSIFIDQRNKAKTSVCFDCESTNLTQIVQSVQGGSLFAEEKEFFIENFFSKKNKQLKEIAEFLNKNIEQINLLIWEGRELEFSSLKIFSKAKVDKFSFPQSMFQFLDSLGGDKFKSIKLFHDVLKTAKEEIVFYMLIRQFRLMIALLYPFEKEQIDEVKRMQSWQKGKLAKQANLIGEDRLKKGYSNLFKIDLGQKSGTLNLSLSQAIDFFILDL